MLYCSLFPPDATTTSTLLHPQPRPCFASFFQVKIAREQREKEREEWETEKRELDRQREQVAVPSGYNP